MHMLLRPLSLPDKATMNTTSTSLHPYFSNRDALMAIADESAIRADQTYLKEMIQVCS